MSNGAMDKPKAGGGATEGGESPNALDSWLKRELQALYGDAASGELPDEIADLAARLEEKLGRGGSREDDAGTPPRRDGDK